MSAVDGGSPVNSRTGTVRRSSIAPPPAFCSIVVQLIAMQILALGVSVDRLIRNIFLLLLITDRNAQEMTKTKDGFDDDEKLFIITLRSIILSGL